MIDIKLVRENPEKIKKAVKDKARDVDIDKIITLDNEHRSLIINIDKLRHQQKQFGKDEIDNAKKNKSELKELEEKSKIIEIELENLLAQVPNPADDFVPVGDESINKIIDTVGEIPKFDFKIKDHIELGEKLNIIDIKRASKVAGSRFIALKNDGAKLQMAIFQYIIDKITSKGFDFVLPPHIINHQSMQGMGYLEHGGDQETYHLEKDNMYLIGTSEQVLGPMRSNEVFNEKDLPYRVCAFSPCYRREAGSYGKDTKGMFRVHQFHKVEMFSFCKPEDSKKEHEFLLSLEKEIYAELGIPFQVVLIASGDLGDPASAKYDLEAWFAGQNKYREITSTSNTTDFQARRLNIRYKTKTGKNELVHMLNGTGASDRPFIAILENNQNSDGSITIPKVLVKYFGKDKIEVK
ncbi:MAG: Serine-tRNA ligase [Berkelbacteria bacterium GW2011_GWA2_35_9]|uniref:Serine--tRNA ligase n=1 Tax=Berkelbacteria bacterium GW2011_GWA2_35_9 TaxID=1618333 RepID=A0A0G0FNY1_9BACT|nr:MAG: Serine-tRNA ligase [Berkelbacteria bacterium GW2011_GWA2_35_9]